MYVIYTHYWHWFFRMTGHFESQVANLIAGMLTTARSQRLKTIIWNHWLMDWSSGLWSSYIYIYTHCSYQAIIIMISIFMSVIITIYRHLFEFHHHVISSSFSYHLHFIIACLYGTGDFYRNSSIVQKREREFEGWTFKRSNQPRYTEWRSVSYPGYRFLTRATSFWLQMWLRTQRKGWLCRISESMCGHCLNGRACLIY